MAFAEVAVRGPFSTTFTYLIPADLEVALGHAVLVPFGRRRTTGYVVGFSDTTTLEPSKVRSLLRLIDKTPVFDEQQLSLFRWASEYYLAGLGDVISTAIPSSYNVKSRRVYLATDAGIDVLAKEGEEESIRLSVLREVVARPGRTQQAICNSLKQECDDVAVARVLDGLLDAGCIALEERDVGGPKGRRKVVRLTRPNVVDHALVHGARMRSVLAALVEAGGSAPLHDLVDRLGPAIRQSVQRLEENLFVEVQEVEDRRAVDVEGLPGAAVTPPPPNADQQAALDLIASADVGAVLLHGVTGSGKTEVYLQSASRVLAEGRQVLVMVPEIALTPLLLGRFRARFGAGVAVLHSGLTAGERLREWRRIRSGEADVAVGARSALFAPFRDLGLIIVDEEHDDSYKQGDGVRYHARDLAVVRGLQSRCRVVLGSATPSLETWDNVRLGRYQRVLMPRRATPRPVPQIELVNLCEGPRDTILTPRLSESLRETTAAGAQAIVLYNRRGFAPVVECRDCGATFSCPSCGVRLILHKGLMRMSCHYCGFQREYSPNCFSCGNPYSEVGYGTERVAEAVEALLPGVPVGRMDADTTSVKGSHARILESFRAGRIQVLVGTQLVAKGHDFPNVQLAAVVGVDNILSMPDFRSAERTFALVTQLAGRAGRGADAGNVIVQTRHPEHFVFQSLLQPPGEDLDLFYREEYRQRALLRQPPAARLILVLIEGSNRDTAWAEAQALAGRYRSVVHRGAGVQQVLGPVAAPMARLVGRWRFQIVLRGQNPREFRSWMRTHRDILFAPGQRGTRILVDVDPRNLL